MGSRVDYWLGAVLYHQYQWDYTYKDVFSSLDMILLQDAIEVIVVDVGGWLLAEWILVVFKYLSNKPSVRTMKIKAVIKI